MQKLGVTGIIGSGKSTVGKLLQESGYPVLDADKAVHQLYKTSSLLKQKLVDTFGESILESNAISRKNLASIVFQNQTALKQLENIVYPYLKQVIIDYFKTCEQNKQEFAFLEAALLHKIPEILESLDKIWFISAQENVLLERLVKRGLSFDDAKNRLNLQKKNPSLESSEFLTVCKKKSSWIEVIENDKTLDDLKEKISTLLK